MAVETYPCFVLHEGRQVQNSAGKSKGEMCKSIERGGKCSFGAKCKYAHDKSELTHQTLMDRHAAGLIDDLQTFRTRPCLDHVMTGSCPFESRCVGIHDIRINTNTVHWWLPCREQLNAIPTDVHIDYSRKANFSYLHYGSPFSKDTAYMFTSYENFTKQICQHQNRSRDESQQHSESELFPTAVQRLQIALRLSPLTCPSVIKYTPTNLFRNTPCMVRQVRAFDLSCSFSLKPLTMDEVNLDNRDHVIVRELLFGQLSDEETPPPVLCFNIPASEFTECSIANELKYNRKKLKQKRRAAQEKEISHHRVLAPSSSCRGGADMSIHRGLFRMYYSTDSTIFELIQSTMRLEIEKLLFAACMRRRINVTEQVGSSSFLSSCCNSLGTPRNSASTNCNRKRDFLRSFTASDIESRELEICKQIEGLQIFFSGSRWPINQGREYVSIETPLPPVAGFYMPPDDHSKGSHSRQWNSFVQNLGMRTNPSPFGDEVDEFDRQLENKMIPGTAKFSLTATTTILEGGRNVDAVVAMHQIINSDKQRGVNSILPPLLPLFNSDDDNDESTTCGSIGTSNSGGRLPIFKDLMELSEVLEWTCQKCSESIPHIHSRVKGSGSAVVVDEAAKVLFNQEFERDWKQVEDHYKKGEK